MDYSEEHTPETTVDFAFYCIHLIISVHILLFILCIQIFIIHLLFHVSSSFYLVK